MIFKCNRLSLCEAMMNVSKAVPLKSNITALEGVKLSVNNNTLKLTGYDMELGIQTNIDIDSEDTGEIVVNSRLFSEIIRRMSSSELTISVDDKLNVNINGNSTSYDISAISADEYPDLPNVISNTSIDIPQYILKNMIDHTCHAVSTNENKPILTGELFDIENSSFHLVAIDGFRLAVRTENIDSSEKCNFVVPSKTLNEVSKLLYKNETLDDDENEEVCKIHTDKKHIIFEISGYHVISRLLEGEFHNYKASVPDSFKTEVILKTKELSDAVERCSLLINEKNKCPVRCIFDNNSVEISCHTSIGRINDNLNAEVQGERIEIGFNNKYLLDALKASDTDKIRIQLIAPNRPIKILPVAGESFLFLLMPIQLK